MRKITLLFLFVGVFWANAQVRNYTFSKGTSIYDAIDVGSTVLGTSTSASKIYIDPNVKTGGSTYVGPGFDIGFNFTFNGNVYDSFGVSDNGWICLGNSATTPNHVDMNLSNATFPLSSI